MEDIVFLILGAVFIAFFTSILQVHLKVKGRDAQQYNQQEVLFKLSKATQIFKYVAIVFIIGIISGSLVLMLLNQAIIYFIIMGVTIVALISTVVEAYEINWLAKTILDIHHKSEEIEKE